MNVKELKELLNKYPDDMEVCYEKYSDYAPMRDGEIHIVAGVDKYWYMMREHPALKDCEEVVEFLCFPGN